MALPVNMFSGVGVLEYWKNRNSKSQLIKVSVFSIQVSVVMEVSAFSVQVSDL